MFKLWLELKINSESKSLIKLFKNSKISMTLFSMFQDLSGLYDYYNILILKINYSISSFFYFLFSIHNILTKNHFQ